MSPRSVRAFAGSRKRAYMAETSGEAPERLGWAVAVVVAVLVVANVVDAHVAHASLVIGPAGATRIIAAETARHVASQPVPRSAGGIKAADARKSMRTAKITRFRTTMKMNIGISAGWRSGSFLAT
jgi:hypothetical protein